MCGRVHCRANTTAGLVLVLRLFLPGLGSPLRGRSLASFPTWGVTFHVHAKPAAPAGSLFVPETGFEPVRLAASAFETDVSAYSTTRA